MLIKRYKIDIIISNSIFEIDIRESIERKTFFLKEYEKKRMDQLFQYSKKNNSNTFIDVGANIGFYSILFSDKFSRVYSFEPNERNFLVLNKNINKNQLTNIETFNFGLGDQKETLKGHSNTKGELFQTSGFAVSKSSNVGADVLIKKGDDVLQFNNENITLKIDVEGFELFVLKGLEKTLINNCCIIQIEIWEKNNEDVQKFLKLLNYEMMCSIDGDTYFSNKLIE